MAEQQNGLRFDIYERVHLSEGVAGIKELEGVELVPHIQVLPQGDQALLRGNLLLSGTYVDEQDAVNRTLEHLIPVEITLPLNRVHRVEDISVEIENFDVDLLSERSLNITGVLSLNGLEAVSLPLNGDVWNVKEEEVVFVHETASQRQPDNDVNTILKVDEAQEQAGSSAEAQDRKEHQNPKEDSLENPYEWSIEAGKNSKVDRENTAWNSNSDQIGDTNETFNQAANDINEDSFAADEKTDLKIAFTGKRPDEVEPSKSFGLSSLLQSASSVKADPRNPNASSGEIAPAGDRLEWKKLLLSSKSEQQEFRRVRLCIVQKEETLETIAKRYELNPREIVLFNRLPENEVMEGQIVYIPK